VDEAKNSGVKLHVALQAIGEAIVGFERRAHIILSGRYTDWQFRHDLALLNEELAIPADQALPSPPSPDDLVISVIRRETPKAKEPRDRPTVVVMLGLDERRVRQFAAGQSPRRLG
jgi:hypothetical protein